MKPAFSTVACPEWTLERIAHEARRMDYDAVELRTFGLGSTELAPDPALTDPAKTAHLLGSLGVRPCSLATSLRFDERVRPPIIGRVLRDEDRPVRQARRLVHLARDIGCPYLRVFGFELQPRERRRAGVRRIGAQLRRAVDTCRNTGVRMVVENGGSFETADQLAELIDHADTDNLLAAAYSPAVGRQAGCSIDRALDALGEKLVLVKLKEMRDGSPVPLGEGDLGVDRILATLAERGFAGWVVCEHNRVWNRALPDPAHALERASDRFYEALRAASPHGTLDAATHARTDLSPASPGQPLHA